MPYLSWQHIDSYLFLVLGKKLFFIKSSTLTKTKSEAIKSQNLSVVQEYQDKFASEPQNNSS